MCFRYPLIAVALLTTGAVRSQDVAWRHDYARARQEATEKNLPLLVDVGTSDCFWCKQLDGRTFKDPTVAALLNNQFIPLRLDGEREKTLVDALQVQSYPTLLVASPAGKILNVQVGFLDAERFQSFLRNSVAQLPARPGVSPSDWLTEQCTTAARAIEQGQFAQAIPTLRRVIKDGERLPVQAKAVSLLKQVEDQAATKLARARELDAAGKAFDALQEAQSLARNYDGTTAAAEGQALLSTLNAKVDETSKKRIALAKELLAQAREDFRTEQYIICLMRCESLTARFAELTEAAEARALADQIKNNAAWMQQICDALPELNGSTYLTMADAMLKNGQPQQAVFYLERVIQTFPNSRHAELAQAKLAQLQGPPSLPSSDQEKK